MQIRTILDSIFGFMLAIAIFYTSISYFQSKQPFIEVTNNPSEIIRGYKGKTIMYCRDIEYLRDSKVQIEKMLIKNSRTHEMIVIVPVNIHNVHRDKGFSQRICKSLFIGKELSNGIWTLETYLERKDFPFNSMLKLEDVYIEVKDK